MSEITVNSFEEVSVVDVYDLASDIGSEFEKLIDSYGSQAFESLIKKCIRALETLENVALKNEQEVSLIRDLNDQIAKLEYEKLERAKTKDMFEKEVETIEEVWRSETRELISTVSRLQSENHRLMEEHHYKKALKDTSLDCNKFDDTVTQKLCEQVDRQRDEIKQKKRENQEQAELLENCLGEIEILKHQNSEFKKRSKVFQNQIKTLCEERADFLAKLQDQHKIMLALRKKLGIAEKENNDLEVGDATIPRFTVEELKEILNERNMLRNRISDLEEELIACKLVSPNTKPQGSAKEIKEEDPPVQGPLPEEWYTDDGSWRRKSSDSGIRKFFKNFLFADSDMTTHRLSKTSLSSLTRMALSGPHTEIPI
ncbi:CLUMA_CG012866, isoform A [Clunio marinus]|uniref:CLUMA_CG012866, isoform A n=1 Tax=Clunio marinus TaxID=568069 RepID=A0A1J1IH24_9DIPT|nr:CLUMA_CG012866, isoform A [Clunio marinus]